MRKSNTGENLDPAFDWEPDVGREILPPEIFYGAGDATLPLGTGRCIIAHICNDIGAWGRGFVVPLGRRFPEAQAQYRAWYHRKTDPPFALGQVQFVPVRADVWVANMIGQHGIYTQGATPPIRYEALREWLGRVRAFAQAENPSVQMPRFGCGRRVGRGQPDYRRRAGAARLLCHGFGLASGGHSDRKRVGDGEAAYTHSG